jgi:FixJ family two-component response regulator
VAQHPVHMSATTEEPTVFIVDDDQDFRDSLETLLNSIGLKVSTFSSAPEFLRSKLPDVVSCLVLDIRLPDLSGLDLQAELTKASISMPIIFVTGHGDIPMTVRAMKAGAADFLTKPFREQDMLDAVMRALERDRKRREVGRRLADLRSRLQALSPREREVMTLVTAGLMNKQIAARLDVTEVTVKAHRGQVMRKMGARSLADMVKIAEALEIRPPPT